MLLQTAHLLHLIVYNTIILHKVIYRILNLYSILTFKNVFFFLFSFDLKVCGWLKCENWQG